MSFSKLSPIVQNGNLSVAFIKKVNDSFVKINASIDEYNSSWFENSKKEALNKILQHYRQLERMTNPSQIEACPQYHKTIFKELLPELQRRIRKYRILAHPKTLDNFSTSSELVDIIATMPPEKLSKLQKHLMDGTSINDIFLHSEPEFSVFKKFTQENQISFLGGHNSKNYKITPYDGRPSYVLKLEYRFSFSKEVEDHLRSKMASVFTPELISKQSLYVTKEHQPLIRNICINNYYDCGDVESYGQSQNGDLECATEIFCQMGNIVEQIREAGCFFPDMKNSNWMVDASGTLRLADTKAFLFTKNGNIDLADDTGFLCTSFVNPPEFADMQYRIIKGEQLSADKAHSYIFGKNLYQFITGCSANYLQNKTRATQLDFTDPKFQTKDGQLLKELIKKLIVVDTSKRISVNEAVTTLNNIRLMQVESSCDKLLSEIKNLNYLPQRLRYMNMQMQRISEAKSSFDKLSEIKKDLMSVQTRFKLANDCMQILLDIEYLEPKNPLLKERTTIAVETSEKILQELRADLTARRIEAIIISKLKKECESLLSFSSNQGLIESSKNKIGQLTTREELSGLKEELTINITSEIKQGCILLLDENSNIYSNEQVVDFKTQIQSCTTPQNFAQLKIIMEKNLCQHLITKISQLGNEKTRGYVSSVQTKISGSTNLQELEIIKKDLKYNYELINLKQLIEKINQYRFGENDQKMNEFIAEASREIEAATTFEEAQQLTAKYEPYLKQMNNPAILGIKSSIQELRNKANDWFPVGRNDKANRIESEAAKIDIANRIKLVEQPEDIIQGVLKQMASHRLFGPTYSTDDNKPIDEDTAADSYKTFKKRLR